MAENPGAKQRRRGAGRPFRARQSGNPTGKPLRQRNRATRAVETLLDGEAEARRARLSKWRLRETPSRCACV